MMKPKHSRIIRNIKTEPVKRAVTKLYNKKRKEAYCALQERGEQLESVI